MNRKVGIIDIGAGSLNSIVNVFKKLNIDVNILSIPCASEGCTHIVLPGVGAFDDFMMRIEESGFAKFLTDAHESGKASILGVCIGMHVLGCGSDEGKKKGLGLIPGRVEKIADNIVSPHMGWNSLNVRKNSSLLEGIDLDLGFYYLHNYKFVCSDRDNVLATAEYGGDVESIIKRGNTIGVQFHPEKSHSNGLKLFSNFAGSPNA